MNNHILESLSKADLDLLQPHLEPVKLAFRQSCEEPNQPIQYGYFPDNGIISVVANGPGGRTIEVGIIGRDSMTAQPIVMGTDRSANSTFVQVAGSAHRIKASALRDAVEESRSLHRLFLNVVQCFIMQASHTALANGVAKLDQRMARWLLMEHDRLSGDELPLTHEFLSIMLGVRRAGVTTTMRELENAELISTKRKAIQIRDRGKLLALAGGIYGVPEAEQKRLTGWTSQKALTRTSQITPLISV